MHEDTRTWRSLYECDEPHRAQTIVTCLRAMEFDVRLRVGERTWDDGLPEQPLPERHVIEVPTGDWAELRAVLDELMAEQDEFDAKLALRRRRTSRLWGISLILLLIGFAVFALLRLTS